MPQAPNNTHNVTPAQANGSDQDQSTKPARPFTTLGFKGPTLYHAEKPSGAGVVLLEQSLTVSTEGMWRAWGLVRNELNHEVGSVVVTASLFNNEGALLSTPTYEVPVDPIRPGEPVPFKLASQVGVNQVARIQWSIDVGPPDEQATRDIEIDVYWQVPYGESTIKGVQRKDPPYPHLLAAGFRNTGSPLTDIRLVAAWVDTERGNKVVWLETATVHPDVPRPIPAGGTGHFREVKIEDPLIRQYEETLGPEYLYRIGYMLWAIGKKADD